MSFKFFTNTGIQFFGEKNFKIQECEKKLLHEVPGIGKTDLAFARTLFYEKKRDGCWLPLSLDGQRNLLRVFFSINEKDGALFHFFAIDTNLRDESFSSSSLTPNDIAQTLNIKSYDLNKSIEELMSDIPVLEHTKTWIKKIADDKKEKLNKEKDFQDYDPVAAYRLLIALCIKSSNNDNNFFPTVEIMTDQAAAMDLIDTSLVIDLGNSRTIGLFVEKDLQSQKFQLNNATPLRLVDYKKLSKQGIGYLMNYNDETSDEYDYLIGSMIRFKRNLFHGYPESDSKSFILPSIVTLGSEAEDMEGSLLDDSSIGISGPKRYLWSDQTESMYWKFNDGSPIEGDMLEHLPINDDDSALDDSAVEYDGMKKPIHAIYPKRSMMVFCYGRDPVSSVLPDK